MGARGWNIIFQSLGGPVERYIGIGRHEFGTGEMHLLLEIVHFLFWEDE